MKKFIVMAYCVLIGILISSLSLSPSFAVTEQRKAMQGDIEWGPAADNNTSPGGKFGYKIPRYFDSNAFTDNLTLYGNDLITKGPWVDVRAYGTALTDNSIRAAIDALDNAIGGEVFIPTGHYDVTYAIGLLNKNNVKVRGAGVGKTVLHASSLLSHGTLGAAATWGIMWVDGSAGYVDNVVIEEISFELDNVNYSQNQKTLFFGMVSNFTVKNCSFNGGYWESVYHHGATIGGVRYESKNVRIENNYFGPDGLSEQLVFNTPGASRTIIKGNFFDRCAWIGIHVVGGPGTIIDGNILYRVKYWNINAGEGSYPTDAAIITKNILIEPGYGYAGATRGIITATGYDNVTTNLPSVYLRSPRGAIISNNFIYDLSGVGSFGMVVQGNALVSNNTISGVADNTSIVFKVIPMANQASVKQTVHLVNNTVVDTNSGNTWATGLIVGQDSTVDNQITVYSRGNYWGDIGDVTITVWNSGDNSANIYIQGDIISPNNTGDGNITLRKGFAPATITGSLIRGVPLYINNASKLPIYQLVGDDTSGIASFTDNATTPSVAGKKICQTANTGATSITNFTGGLRGQEITVLFTDNVTTLVNGTTIKLVGAANFVATPNDTITLILNGTVWYEKSRSVN